MFQSFDEGRVKMTETLTTQISEFEDKIQKLNENLENNRVEKSDFLASFIDQCINAEVNGMTSVIEDSIKLNNETKDSLDNFNVQISAFIDENQKILDKYANEEIIIDSATGLLFLRLFKIISFFNKYYIFKVQLQKSEHLLYQAIYNVLNHMLL